MSESSPTQVELPPAISAPESDPIDASPASAVDKLAEADSRATKRRKNCPKSLDKFQDSPESNRDDRQSFTFHTTAAPAPEFTPKFGYFKLPAAALEPETAYKHILQASSYSEETTAEAEQAQEQEPAAENANGITGK